METWQQTLKKINQLLDQLIDTAIQLRDVSERVISEEELAPLQQKQEDLLNQLEKADQQLQQYSSLGIDSKLHGEYHQKLQEFQELNQSFINNLNTSHGLIQFDLQRLSEDDEMSLVWKRLNKMSFAPNSTKTIKSKEHK